MKSDKGMVSKMEYTPSNLYAVRQLDQVLIKVISCTFMAPKQGLAIETIPKARFLFLSKKFTATVLGITPIRTGFPNPLAMMYAT